MTTPIEKRRKGLTMLKKISKIKNEKGESEIITLLFILPLLVWLIFSVIDVSLYMNVRSTVANAARDGARQAAIYGGNNSRLNPNSPTSVAEGIKATLWDGTKCRPSACTAPPEVTCTPDITSNSGEIVKCSIKYYYTSAAPGNPFAGFSNFLTKPFTVTEVSRSETGFSR